MKRWKTWSVRGAAVVVVGVAALFVADAIRRARLPTDEKRPQAGETVDDRRFDFSDPKKFQDLCDRTRAKYYAMDDRYKAMLHERRQRSREVALDDAEKILGDEELVETVVFDAGEEKRTTVSQTDMVTGKPMANSLLQTLFASSRKPYLYPLSRDEKPGDFEYRFDGMEKLGERTTAKIGFTANEPIGRKLQGVMWVDPATGDPLKFWGRWPAPQAPVDKYEMTVEYAPAETGRMQIRKVTTDGSGGFAFFTRRFLVEIDFHKYRPRE